VQILCLRIVGINYVFLSLALPISTYAKYCYRKLQKVAVTGGKKVNF